MSSPWSDQPSNTTPIGADKSLLIDSTVSAGPLQQKLSTLTEVISIFTGSRQIRVKSQADLEAEFGVDIEIPAGQSFTVEILESFTLTKPFKIGLGSGLQVKGIPTNTQLSYTGTGALFRNTVAGDAINFLDIDDMGIFGLAGNDIFDITGAFVVSMSAVFFGFFGNAGSLQTTFFDITFTAIAAGTGLIIINPLTGRFQGFNLNQNTVPPETLITIKTTIDSQITVDSSFSSDATSSIIFFDPNSGAGARLTIEGSTGVYADLFQQGTDIAVDSAALGTSGAGFTEFTAASVHGLEVGQAVVNSTFADSAYNGTFIVTAIPSTTIYEVETTFTATGTGNLNAASLDQTDPKVLAMNNVSTPDSMTIAEARSSGTLTVTGGVGVEEPIVDLTPSPGDWIEDGTTERFSVNTTTGIVTYNGTIDITVMIKYSLSAAQVGGGAQVLDFDLHISGVEQAKTIISFTTTGSGNFTTIVFNGGNFLISPGDTFQLFKTSDSANNAEVKDATLLINLD